MRKLPVVAAFKHIVRSTFNNIGFAWHVSWPWMLAILPINVIGNFYTISSSPVPGEMSAQVAFVSLLIAIPTMFAFASVAVSWHRYILRDEVPHGWARLRADNTVWRYFGNTILIIFILVAALVPVALVAGGLLAVGGTAGAIIAVPIYLAAVVFSISAFYRMSVKLPAIALERRDYSIGNALTDTRGNHWPLLGLALLFALVMIVLAFVIAGFGVALGATGNVFALFVLVGVQLVVNWFATIMAVTLLTSLYGFFVEKRDF